MKQRTWTLPGILALALSVMVSSVVAQGNYPATQIRLIVGFAPGGSNDLVGRLMAQKLSSQMNVPVIVENKDGANGNISAEFVSKSKPDGYTVLYNSAGVVLSPAFGEKLGYDLFKDLEPVALIGTQPHLLFVHPAVPANSPAEFIAYVKANPDKLAYGSGGTGSPTHLAPLLFLQVNGLSAVHVPYKGSGPAMVDLISGRIQFSLQSATTGLPMVKEKRLRVLAIAGLKRSPLLPDVPTLSETVMPGFETGSWYGVMVPAKTPPEIVKRLNAEVARALQDPDVRSRLAQQFALEPIDATPQQYAAYLRSELERWTKVIKTAGVKLE